MKKAELIKRIPKKLPEENMARIIRACGTHVLMLILPVDSKGGSEESGIAHFVWEMGYATYYLFNHIWTREALDSVEDSCTLTMYGFDEKSVEQIRKFTGHSSHNADYAIGWYEEQIRFRKRDEAQKRKQKRIDDFMKDTPALPKGFLSWCKSKLRADGRKRIYVKLFQEMERGQIERIFWVDDYMPGEKVTEICRAYTDVLGGAWKYWFYGERFFRTGNRQKFWDRKWASILGPAALPTWHYIFDNLDSLDLTNAQRSTLRIMSGKTDPSNMLYRLRSHPQLEQLAKAGMIRLAAECYLQDADKIFDRLHHLGKEKSKRLIQYDGGSYALRMLDEHPELNDTNLKEICRIRDEYKQNALADAAAGLNINHVMTLLRKTGGIKMSVIQEYADYIKMAKDRHMQVTDEIVYRNKRWKEFHDKYLEEANRKKDLARAKKYGNIQKDYDRNRQIFGWQQDGYVILVPRSAMDIIEEGRRQHHCVGAHDGYMAAMARRDSFILFLRKQENPEEPYYTIETDLSRIKQFYAAYDRQPDKEIVEKVLAMWMKQVKENYQKVIEAERKKVLQAAG